LGGFWVGHLIILFWVGHLIIVSPPQKIIILPRVGLKDDDHCNPGGHPQREFQGFRSPPEASMTQSTAPTHGPFGLKIAFNPYLVLVGRI